MRKVDSRLDYVIRVLESPLAVDAAQWDALLRSQDQANPFMSHAYLSALHQSHSACARTGWSPFFITLWDGDTLAAACALYVKSHSYGEYVFDWAWANAYQQHGLAYYPKATVAVPFTPVPGPRLLACDAQARAALIDAVLAWCESKELSSLHLLFGNDDDTQGCTQAGLMLRHTVQFHWSNASPAYGSFTEFLASLAQDKRKKIRQERRKVSDAGVAFIHKQGAQIGTADWDFFYRCYERTYLEHGNAPYLSRDFFQRMQDSMADNWLLFIGLRGEQPIACSLIALNDAGGPQRVAYGRYWGALERVDCLHFEACYYQPLEWCIAHGYHRFEGGAQGEHKMARALLPVKTSSAHWLSHPAFADAVARYLEREGAGVEDYLEQLESRSPLRPAVRQAALEGGDAPAG